MAHFVRHLPPRWELVRAESRSHQQYREVLREQLAAVERSRIKTSGLWWNDQRYVDQVVPAQFVHPDFFDTFNYRYQLYARPLPICAPPRSLAEACDHPMPVGYNVKRIAVDKVWVPGTPGCTQQWTKHSCCPPIKRETAADCSHNNNKRFNRQSSSKDNFQALCPLQRQTSGFNQKGQLGLSDVDLLSRQNIRHAQGSGDTNSSANRANIYSGDIVDIGNCAVVTSKNKESKYESLKTISPNDEIDHLCRQSTGACRLAADRTEDVSTQSETCLPARTIAIRNKVRVTRDTVASLLCNKNNNRRGDLSNEAYGIVIVDNLISTDHEDSSSTHPDTTFSSQPDVCDYQPDSQDGAMSPLSRCHRLWYNDNLCQNNNTECENLSEDRPGCIPRHCCERSWCTQSPFEAGTSRAKTFRRKTPCMELLSHLQNRAKPKCLTFQTSKPADRRSSQIGTETAYDRQMWDLGYMSYKIIGGSQYRLPPPRDYTADVKLPRHLEEYREFTRRCPNPNNGRYDRSDPANEMMLPGNISSNLIKVQRNPFVYMRNPKCHSFSPLFYTPSELGELTWGLPSAMLNPQ